MTGEVVRAYDPDFDIPRTQNLEDMRKADSHSIPWLASAP